MSCPPEPPPNPCKSFPPSTPFAQGPKFTLKKPVVCAGFTVRTVSLPVVPVSVATESERRTFQFCPDRFHDLRKRFQLVACSALCRALSFLVRDPPRQGQDVHEGVGTQKPRTPVPPATFNGSGDFLRICRIPAVDADDVSLQVAPSLPGCHALGRWSIARYRSIGRAADRPPFDAIGRPGPTPGASVGREGRFAVSPAPPPHDPWIRSVIRSCETEPESSTVRWPWVPLRQSAVSSAGAAGSR